MTNISELKPRQIDEPKPRKSLRARTLFPNPESFTARSVGGVIDKVSGLDFLDTVYQGIEEREDTDKFLAEVLVSLGFDYVVAGGSIDRIPETGPVVVVSNHPFGGADGIAIAHLLRSIRPDCKLLVNGMLGCIDELSEIFLNVNVYGGTKENIKPLRETLAWLRQGGLLFVFPSGEVSTINFSERRISDPPWNESVARLIKKAKVPVVPMFVHGHNSFLFQFLSVLHPRVKTMLLPRELGNKRGVTAKIHIGKAIPAEQLEAFDTSKKLASYLRARTYLLSVLGGRRRVLKWIPNVRGWFDRQVKDAPVAAAESGDYMQNEIDRLGDEALLVASGNYEVYVAMAAQIPATMREIGRLREITFREVGEGTGRERDIDRYDDYYHQLFIWDKKNRMVVGGYRLGIVSEIVPRFGARGLYTGMLFRFSPAILRDLANAIELGRSFVRPEYQRTHSSLMLLWRGIGAFVARNPSRPVLFGPVSISNDYQHLSQQLLVQFLRAQRYEVDRARHVRARNRFKFRRKKLIGDLGIEEIDLRMVSEFVGELEQDDKGVPILIRQYLKMGGQIIGFSIDTKFSDSLDCLLMVDMTQTELPLLQRYLGEAGADSFLAYHAATDPERFPAAS